jgi:hypothetical protein
VEVEFDHVLPELLAVLDLVQVFLERFLDDLGPVLVGDLGGGSGVSGNSPPVCVMNCNDRS